MSGILRGNISPQLSRLFLLMPREGWLTAMWVGIGFASYSCKFSKYEYSSFGKNTKRIWNIVCLYVVLVRRATRSLYVHVRKFTWAYKRFVSCSDKKNEYEYLDIWEKNMDIRIRNEYKSYPYMWVSMLLFIHHAITEMRIYCSALFSLYFQLANLCWKRLNHACLDT